MVTGGSGSPISSSVVERDNASLVKHLTGQGMVEADASALAAIMAAEEPENEEAPFGVNAKKWLKKNLKTVAEGGWNVSKAVANSVLTQAALAFYDLK